MADFVSPYITMGNPRRYVRNMIVNCIVGRTAVWHTGSRASYAYTYIVSVNSTIYGDFKYGKYT